MSAAVTLPAGDPAFDPREHDAAINEMQREQAEIARAEGLLADMRGVHDFRRRRLDLAIKRLCWALDDVIDARDEYVAAGQTLTDVVFLVAHLTEPRR